MFISKLLNGFSLSLASGRRFLFFLLLPFGRNMPCFGLKHTHRTHREKNRNTRVYLSFFSYFIFIYAMCILWQKLQPYSQAFNQAKKELVDPEGEACCKGGLFALL